MNLQYDMDRIDLFRELLVRLREGGAGVRKDFEFHFGDANVVELLLLQYELVSGRNGVKMADVVRFNVMFPLSLAEDDLLDGHPVLIFREEIARFRDVLNEVGDSLDSKDEATQGQLVDQMTLLGGLYNHFNRKEKLFFPMMEREQLYTLPRVMWQEDDRIRGLYQAALRRMERLPLVDIELERKTYNRFAGAFREMLLQEELILLPVMLSTLSEEVWWQIAIESDAFGYAMGVVVDAPATTDIVNVAGSDRSYGDVDTQRNLPFGGGFLSLKEADLILNHLPVEITFIDKNGIFKYFNERGNYADMVLVRTPASIGRNVANCHPPKSMKKVMRLIRELKYGKRKSETMWFKKRDHFVHITYTALFDNDGEYLGILECVQDIQPFFELEREAKRGISRIGEE